MPSTEVIDAGTPIRVHFGKSKEMDKGKDKSPIKLIIDTDPGVDDALALGIALTWPTAEVVAVTCVHGNVGVDQCCINASKVLDAFGRQDVPLYKGAAKPLIGDTQAISSTHGKDGLGDCTDCWEEPLVPLEENHAAMAIIEFARKYKNEITLCAIGPLTNLALAIKLMPELPSFLKEVIILGGNYSAVGNRTATAEFNFLSDPAAAHVVLEEYFCPIIVIPWETAKKNMYLPKNFLKQTSSRGNPRARLFGKLSDSLWQRGKRTGENIHIVVDPIAIAVALNREVAVECCQVYGVVETTGKYTKGMMVVDWNSKMGRKPNITLVKEVNKNKIQDMIEYSIS